MVHAWERQRGETEAAYQAFAAFRELGLERTVVGAARVIGKDQALLHRWSNRYGWRDRALLFDRHNEAVERKAAENERRKRAALVERRRLKYLDDKYEIGQASMDAGKKLIEKNGEDGTFDHAVKLIRTGADFVREYVDEATYDPDLDDADATQMTAEQAIEYQDRIEADRAARRKVQVSRGDD